MVSCWNCDKKIRSKNKIEGPRWSLFNGRKKKKKKEKKVGLKLTKDESIGTKWTF